MTTSRWVGGIPSGRLRSECDGSKSRPGIPASALSDSTSQGSEAETAPPWISRMPFWRLRRTSWLRASALAARTLMTPVAPPAASATSSR